MPVTVYSVELVPEEYRELAVHSVRITIHSMGPVVQGSQLSQNHWTLELLCVNNVCVRLDMQLHDPASETDFRGILRVSRLTYQLSQNHVNYFDYAVLCQLTVGHFTTVIIDRNRHRYLMTENGVGCRHWISVVIKDWQDAGLIAQHTTQGQRMENYIAWNWSKGQDPIQLEVKEGVFY